jgi:hypothetical protein
MICAAAVARYASNAHIVTAPRLPTGRLLVALGDPGHATPRVRPRGTPLPTGPRPRRSESPGSGTFLERSVWRARRATLQNVPSGFPYAIGEPLRSGRPEGGSPRRRKRSLRVLEPAWRIRSSECARAERNRVTAATPPSMLRPMSTSRLTRRPSWQAGVRSEEVLEPRSGTRRERCGRRGDPPPGPLPGWFPKRVWNPPGTFRRGHDRSSRRPFQNGSGTRGRHARQPARPRGRGQARNSPACTRASPRLPGARTSRHAPTGTRSGSVSAHPPRHQRICPWTARAVLSSMLAALPPGRRHARAAAVRRPGRSIGPPERAHRELRDRCAYDRRGGISPAPRASIDQPVRRPAGHALVPRLLERIQDQRQHPARESTAPAAFARAPTTTARRSDDGARSARLPDELTSGPPFAGAAR